MVDGEEFLERSNRDERIFFPLLLHTRPLNIPLAEQGRQIFLQLKQKQCLQGAAIMR